MCLGGSMQQIVTLVRFESPNPSKLFFTACILVQPTRPRIFSHQSHWDLFGWIKWTQRRVHKSRRRCVSEPSNVLAAGHFKDKLVAHQATNFRENLQSNRQVNML
ncbi:unnamed protein product [Durusdinium trenchii]|uniref:Uncharacterized protein n=1 Tax=Durusdinium trenchii TaxID=1381693 RepID=A0ABP0KHL5_9DINO